MGYESNFWPLRLIITIRNRRTVKSKISPKLNFSKSNSTDPKLRIENSRFILISNMIFQHHIWCLLGPDFFHLRWNSQRTNFICNLYSVHDYSKCQALRSKWRSRIDQKKNVYNFGSSPPNWSLLRSRHVDQIRIQAIRLDPNEVPKA